VDRLVSPQGEFDLERVPVRPKQALRGWDAADEFVLEDLEANPLREDATVVVVGDGFGSLTCALRGRNPVVINESAAGAEAISANLARNTLEEIEVYSVLDLETLTDPIDYVVVKIPKSASELVDVLHRLRPHLHSESRIVGAAMAKHVHSSTLEHFESIVGPTSTSLARKKARLIYSTFDYALEAGTNPWPQTWSADGSTLVNHGGGFSPGSIDVGTRFLLANVPSFADLVPGTGEPVRLVDLGCGNGIIGLRAGRDLSDRSINFLLDAVDDSAIALDAAERSWEATLPGVAAERVAFRQHHRLIEAVPKRSVDLVIVNPPFHDDRVVGDDTAWSMFTDSHKVLRPGGSLLVVGNRHLAYHAKLKKIFGKVDTIASNKKFVVLRAYR
jgi:23S rRNA (guanine1835-N2)-methyltransferase